MARIGSYNWSPRQMERINARRMERNREPLVNVKNIKTEEDYRAAQNLVASSKDNRKPATPAFPSERPSALDQYKGQKSLTDRMAERPSALDNQPSSMESRRAIAGEEFRKKFGKGQKGISTPMTKSAMERVMGTA